MCACTHYLVFKEPTRPGCSAPSGAWRAPGDVRTSQPDADRLSDDRVWGNLLRLLGTQRSCQWLPSQVPFWPTEVSGFLSDPRNLPGSWRTHGFPAERP